MNLLVLILNNFWSLFIKNRGKIVIIYYLWKYLFCSFVLKLFYFLKMYFKIIFLKLC